MTHTQWTLRGPVSEPMPRHGQTHNTLDSRLLHFGKTRVNKRRSRRITLRSHREPAPDWSKVDPGGPRVVACTLLLLLLLIIFFPRQLRYNLLSASKKITCAEQQVTVRSAVGAFFNFNGAKPLMPRDGSSRCFLIWRRLAEKKNFFSL